jgi:UTP--glucose-1-phosphate uridylyltransferase
MELKINNNCTEKSSTIRKAVIPAAGLGTRFLPVTKAIPKELMPIAGKPLIQYAVEEAAASGVETVILVVSPGKHLLAEYFKGNRFLEERLLEHGRDADARALRQLTSLAEIRTVCQDSPRGLADAVGCARSEVGDEPFAVILPDTLIDSEVPCTRQLIDCYEAGYGCVIATREVDAREVGNFGILDIVATVPTIQEGRIFRVLSLTERPRPAFANSRFGIFGRYVLDPAIFSCIDQISPGFAGELQLTDALTTYSRHSALFAYCFEGSHYDAGDKVGFINATIDYALKQPDLSNRVRQLLASRNLIAVSGN